MSENKSSVSNANSYQQIGEFWDRHDLTEVWDRTEAVEFSVDIESERRYFALDVDISNQVSRIAKTHGISPEMLINLWIQEKLSQQA
ncbi:MAG: CopG family antitoxin [Candidatus Competibacteraceae bacterium]